MTSLQGVRFAVYEGGASSTAAVDRRTPTGACDRSGHRMRGITKARSTPPVDTDRQVDQAGCPSSTVSTLAMTTTDLDRDTEFGNTWDRCRLGTNNPPLPRGRPPWQDAQSRIPSMRF